MIHDVSIPITNTIPVWPSDPPVSRFQKSKQLVSYLGLNPTEESSGGKQRLGSISKQGNPMLRYLLIETAQTASKFDPELRRDYQRLKFRRGSGVAKVAIARKLAVRLYWNLREAAQPNIAARMQGARLNSQRNSPSGGG